MTFDVKIVVYVDNPNTTMQTNHIKTFTQLGYTTLVDAIHKHDRDHIYNNTKNARLFIQDDEDVYMFTREELRDAVVPDFAIIFSDDLEIVEENWKQIHQYVKEHLTDSIIDMTNTMKVHTIMGKPTEMKAALDLPTLSKENDFYDLHTFYIEEDDIMIYEVLKPFTDLPYTAVTRNYSKKGHLPFFTDLFICQSWGVARSDILFLKSCWDYLLMTGDFNLDKLLKDATEKCLPGENYIPEPEPEVYRRTLKDVVSILKEKKSFKTKSVPDFIKNKSIHA